MKQKLIYHTQVPANEVAGENEVTVFGDESSLTRLSTQLTAVARDGMTLNCDRLTLDTLLPNLGSVSPRQPKALNLSFCLNSPRKESSERIDALCELFYVRRLSRDIFQLELKFKSLEKGGEELIDQYVDQQLKMHSQAA